MHKARSGMALEDLAKVEVQHNSERDDGVTVLGRPGQVDGPGDGS